MSRDIAKVAHQMELERLFNKNQLMSRLRIEFENESDGYFLKLMREVGIPTQFGIDLLCQMALHRRCDAKTLIGVLKHHFPTAQQVADMLEISAKHDLVDWDDRFGIFIVKYVVSDDVQQELDRYQFPLPMVVKPKTVTTNRESGMLVSNSSIILKHNHHDDDVCLDHINRVNSIKLCIDNKTALMMANRWRNMDKPKEGETRDDFRKRQRAFEKYDRVAKAVIKTVISYDNEFYLTHKYDKRGRTYCQGYHVSYQGAPWNKAVIQLADKELVV